MPGPALVATGPAGTVRETERLHAPISVHPGT